MTNEQIQALKAAAESTTPGEWAIQFGDEIYASDGVNHDQIAMLFSDNSARDAEFIAAANPSVVLSLLAERDADKALIAEQAKRIAELECVCAESYQVVGALADSLGVFNDTKTIKALDNLSAQMLVHTDVLPFSVESRTLTVKFPSQTYFDDPLSAYEAIEKCRDALSESCAAAGITLVVGE